jgi:N-acetyl-anhydromuramyl-L-alanine amidase AmpD
MTLISQFFSEGGSQMLTIDTHGMVAGDARVMAHRIRSIERQKMARILGIVVHQSGSADEQSVFSSYKRANANGAHFLISKMGGIYQTASLLFRTHHVGKIKARCLAEHRCSPAEIITYGTARAGAINKAEMLKTVPVRYPSNQDSIGIEIVGAASLPAGKTMPPGLTVDQKALFIGENAVYEKVNAAQQTALQYLIDELAATLHVPKNEIHRHPDVSSKNKTEAATAIWK